MDDLVVKSKAREYVKTKGIRISGDVFEALSRNIASDLDSAITRAKNNGRKTIKAFDL